jgi:XTP/dITP diphosphohydrolase
MRKIEEDTIVIATHNNGKLVEISELFKNFKIKTISVSKFNLKEPKETESTFIGNARIKAHFASEATGLPALSDDSGLVVDGLNGAPGVYTADWATTAQGRNFDLAMEKVWSLLEEKKTPFPRIAHFICVLCLAWPDGHDEIFEGSISGQIVWPMKGTKGFGFDPVFLPDGQTKTFGEMSPEKKHNMSHRSVAFKKLLNACFP